jgi:hypothetical protein
VKNIFTLFLSSHLATSSRAMLSLSLSLSLSPSLCKQNYTVVVDGFWGLKRFWSANEPRSAIGERLQEVEEDDKAMVFFFLKKIYCFLDSNF